MSENHPDPQMLESFMLGRLSSNERRSVVRHLLSGCRQCHQVTAQLWPAGPRGTGPAAGAPPEEPTADSGSLVQRVMQSVRATEVSLEADRSQAPRLYRELERHPVGRQLILARNSRRFRTWSLCELVIERTRHACLNEPAKALQLAELGIVIAQSLSNSEHGLSLTNDMRARAWFTLGNAHRVAGDLASSDTAFEEARTLLAQGTGDPLEEGRFLDNLALLRRDQGCLEEAIRLSDRAMRCFRSIGDVHLVGRAMTHKAAFCALNKEPDRAVALFRQALSLLDPEVEPRMILVAKQNLMYLLQEEGQIGEALQLLQEIRPRYASMGNRMDLIRLRWVEGKLSVGLNRPQVAELAYLEVRKSFIEQGLALDAALVSFDLASLYLRQGRSSEVKSLAEEMLAVFESHEVPREATAALVVFRQAVELERVSEALIGEITDYLEKVGTNPGLAFRPPSHSGDR